MRQGKRAAVLREADKTMVGVEAVRAAKQIGERLMLLVGRKIERPLSAALVLGVPPRLEDIEKGQVHSFRGAKQADVERAAAVINRIRRLNSESMSSDALKLGEKLLSSLEREYGCEHPILAPVLFECARLQTAIGCKQRAEALQIQVCWVIEGAYGAVSQEAVCALHTLSIFYLEAGAHAKAKTSILAARLICSRLASASALEAKTDAIAGRLAMSADDYQHAIACFESADRTFAAEPTGYIRERSELHRLTAECFCRLGEPGPAQVTLERALGFVMGSESACYPAVASKLLLELSKLCARNGAYERALTLAAKAEKNAIIGCGSISRTRAYCLANLGALLNRAGYCAGAATALEEALSIFDQIGPENAAIIVDIYDLLYDVYQAMGQTTEARTFHMLSRATRSAMANSEGPQTRLLH